MRPLGPLRGCENWYTHDQIETQERSDISTEFARVRLLSYWEDRSFKAEQEVGAAPKFKMDNGIPWTDFMVAFKSALLAGKDDLQDVHKKRMLYNNLKPQGPEVGFMKKKKYIKTRK